MESVPLQVFLRVLYTVNNNPQYILARSSSQVLAIKCNGVATQSVENGPTYARAQLKACLAAVCDSSPELLQDPTRDFSLYVLDPLEAQPLPMGVAHTPQNTNSPRGVAVALGLMSWALESNGSENVFVTGTIIPNVSPALEVVFALRETKRMPKPIHPSPGLMHAPGTPQLPQVTGTGWSYTCNTQLNQQERPTLTRSADFPELYIGPPRRGRGRPEGSTSLRSKVTPQTGNSSLSGAGSSKVAETRSSFNQETGKRSKSKARSRPSRAPLTHSPFICAPLGRSTEVVGLEKRESDTVFSHQQSHQLNQNPLHPQVPHLIHNPLLGLLSAISSTSSRNTATVATPEQQAALLSVLQGLLITNPRLLQPSTTNTEISASSREPTTENKLISGESKPDREDGDGDSDIVVLDSSTVDTTAFRKRNSTQLASSGLCTPPATNQASLIHNGQNTGASLPLANTQPSGQADGPLLSDISAPTTVSGAGIEHVSLERAKRESAAASCALEIPMAPTQSRVRKRKLNEYIPEQVHSSTSRSSSPSPSMARISSSGRVSIAKPQDRSFPTCGMKPASLPSTRLPSMLGSMRVATASSSRLQSKNGNHLTTLVPSPSEIKAGDPGNIDPSLNDTVSDATSLKRRRTLNEFMAEHEARNSAKPRKRSSSWRKFAVDLSTNVPQGTASRSAKTTSASKLSQPSPSRPNFKPDLVATSLPIPTGQPCLVPGAPISNQVLSSTPMASSTPPLASSSAAAPTNNPLKNFVLPAWARTSTAMLPRLSEEVLTRQRAEREAKKTQMSLRRREAAKEKRKRLHGADRPSKESSEEDDGAVRDTRARRALHPSPPNASRPTHMPPPPSAALPVFASDAVEPISPPSPPQSQRLSVAPVPPSTPPRKPVSPGSVPHRTPGKSESCSLFTPSGQDIGSLFTPSTPSATRSLNRVTFTPRSPTVFLHSGTMISPRTGMPQTPRRSGSHRQTPRGLRSGRHSQFVSPNKAGHTSLTQTYTGMGARTFLLPPPSPSPSRSLYSQKQVQVSENSTQVNLEDPGTIRAGLPSERPGVTTDKGKGHQEADGISSGEPEDALVKDGITVPTVQQNPNRSTANKDQGANRPCDMSFNSVALEAEKDYAPSPLPPSSPLPATPLSSPAKRQHYEDSHFSTPTTDDLMPDSDVLFPMASDSNGLPDATILPSLSDNSSGLDPASTAWFSDSDANAWLTETEAWLTDTESGHFPTDSDGAWLSDSDAILGDMSSLPPSTASNWLSDDADIDTDGEFGATMEDGEVDTTALERAFVAFVEHTEWSADRGRDECADDNGGSSTGSLQSAKAVDSELWDSLRPLLELKENLGTVPVNLASDVGAATGEDNSNDREGDQEVKAAQPIQALWDDLDSTG